MTPGRFSRALTSSAGDSDDPNSSNREVPFYRGVPKDATDPFRPGAFDLVFVTPSTYEAKIFAGYLGSVVPCQVMTDNILEGWNPDHLPLVGADPGDAQELRLFDSAYVECDHWIGKIREAGFDGFYVRDYPMRPQGYMNIALFGSDKVRAV